VHNQGVGSIAAVRYLIIFCTGKLQSSGLFGFADKQATESDGGFGVSIN
jgi:hypothetical protein